MNIALRPFGADRTVFRGWNNLAEAFTLKRALAVLVALATILFAVGWLSREDPAKKPYLDILGGGFIFNYRVAEVYYGFTATVQKPLAVGTIIEATFDNPAGGDPFVVAKRANTRTDRYTFRSPPVHGVEAGRPYHIVIRIYDRQKTELIWTTTRGYESTIGDEVMPDRPLTVGPGYTRNPDL